MAEKGKEGSTEFWSGNLEDLTVLGGLRDVENLFCRGGTRSWKMMMGLGGKRETLGSVKHNGTIGRRGRRHSFGRI